MDNSITTSSPAGGHSSTFVGAAPAFSLVSSPAGLGPLIPSSARLRLIPEAARNADARSLLDGFSRLLRFLLDEEIDFLCGVPRKARSPKRINFRGGFRVRTVHTHLGALTIRVPLLRYLHPRVSIVKRAKRLSPVILAELSRIHAAGATTTDAATLINSIWTLPLSAELHATLAAKLAPILETWRAGADSHHHPATSHEQQNSAHHNEPPSPPTLDLSRAIPLFQATAPCAL